MIVRASKTFHSSRAIEQSTTVLENFIEGKCREVPNVSGQFLDLEKSVIT